MLIEIFFFPLIWIAQTSSRKNRRKDSFAADFKGKIYENFHPLIFIFLRIKIEAVKQQAYAIKQELLRTQAEQERWTI